MFSIDAQILRLRQHAFSTTIKKLDNTTGATASAPGGWGCTNHERALEFSAIYMLPEFWFSRNFGSFTYSIRIFLTPVS